MSKVSGAYSTGTPNLGGWWYDATVLTSEVFLLYATTGPVTFDLPDDLPFAFSLTALAAHLAPLVDQRTRRGIR